MLKSAVALITGGASGLGKATVERFIRSGSKVVICDLPTSKGNDLAKSLGNDAIFVPVDVTSEQDVTTAIETVKSKFGRLDVTVNCAGTAACFKIFNFKTRRVHELADFVRVLTVNTIGTFNVIRLSAGLIGQNEPNVDGQRGVIVNTAAIHGYDGQIGQAAYAASNAGIIGMTLPIARDLSSQGIRVVTIAPGLFDTQMIGDLPAECFEFLCDTIPSPQRFGRPDEFAQMVESVVENPMLNGITIRLDGGTRLVI